MLVETGFISNPDEEQRLNDPGYRSRAGAAAITDGVSARISSARRRRARWYAARAAGDQAGESARRASSVAASRANTRRGPATPPCYHRGCRHASNPACRSACCPTPSSTRSPPAKSSSGRRPWSRNWSRTRSTPAPRRIDIDLEEGGIRLIRVRDDGGGMDAGDIAAGGVAPRDQQDRHRSTTSKQVATLGFRGEALPSIASVSRFALTSRPRGAARTARRLEVDGGKVGARRAARASARHHGRGARPVLQRAGAAQVPARRTHRARPRRGVAALAGAGAARRRTARRAQRQAVATQYRAGRATAGAGCSALARGARRGLHRRTALRVDHAARRPAPARLGRRCRLHRAPAPTSSTSTSTAAACATASSRTRCARPMPTCCSMAGIRPTCCSWNSIRAASTSTCIRPSTRCASATAGWCTTSSTARCTRRWPAPAPASRAPMRRCSATDGACARGAAQWRRAAAVADGACRCARRARALCRAVCAARAEHRRVDADACGRGAAADDGRPAAAAARLRAGAAARHLHPRRERRRPGRSSTCTRRTNASATNGSRPRRTATASAASRCWCRCRWRCPSARPTSPSARPATLAAAGLRAARAAARSRCCCARAGLLAAWRRRALLRDVLGRPARTRRQPPRGRGAQRTAVDDGLPRFGARQPAPDRARNECPAARHGSDRTLRAVQPRPSDLGAVRPGRDRPMVPARTLR